MLIKSLVLIGHPVGLLLGRSLLEPPSQSAKWIDHVDVHRCHISPRFEERKHFDRIQILMPIVLLVLLHSSFFPKEKWPLMSGTLKFPFLRGRYWILIVPAGGLFRRSLLPAAIKRNFLGQLKGVCFCSFIGPAGNKTVLS